MNADPDDPPQFPPRMLDRGDLDWRARRRDDGYDYAAAATAGAALARSHLGPKPEKRPVGRRQPLVAQIPAPNPFDAYRPRTAAPVGMPAYVEPDDTDIPPGEEPPDDDWRDRMTVQSTTDSARAMFELESADLQMTVLLDHGLHRHVSFRRPDSGMYRFDLVTWPGNLVIRGDMGTYAFAREPDMFEWFGTGPINPSYWGEKLTSIDKHGGFREYSEELFWRHVDETLTELPTPRAALIRRELRKEAEHFSDFSHRENAFDELRGYREFQEAWEWNVDDFTHHFLYSLHSIAWGISQWRNR